MSLVVLQELVSMLSDLPGIGPRTAERLAFHILKMSQDDVLALADAVRRVKTHVKPCSRCFNLTDQDPCTICADQRRDQGVICVVEQPKDLASIESAGSYEGVYHVLMGHVSPLEGIEPEHLTIQALSDRVRGGTVREVIMATNPTMEGDGTALHIASMLSGMDVKVTRLARGLPIGSQLEFASRATLSDAMSGRRQL